LTLAVLAYASLVPFYYLRPLSLTANLPPFSFARYLPLCAGVFMLLVWTTDLLRGVARFARTPVDLPVICILAAGLASLVNAPFFGIGVVKLGYYTLTGILFSYLLAYSLNSVRAIHRYLIGIGSILAVTVAYTAFCRFAGQDHLWGEVHRAYNPYSHDPVYRASAPFGNPISTGTYLVLGLPLIVWLCRHAPSLRFRAVHGLVACLALYVVLVTQSRGAWLSLAAVAAIFAAYGAGILLRRLSPTRIAVLLTIAVLSLPVANSLSTVTGITSRVETLVARVADRAQMLFPDTLLASEGFRIAQYRTTANVLRDHPLLGIGWGNFTRVFDRYKDASTPTGPRHTAHTTENMFLMYAVETGVVGLVCALGLFGAVVRLCLKLHHRFPPGSERDLALAVIAAVGGGMLNMLTWDALNDPTIRLLFWILIGVVLALERVTGARGATARA
jgi:putative inorganic carbon (HCO3(-)) transporter